MRLNGINTFTLVDYPWKIAAVVFTAGCNFRCGYCHNRQFVDPTLLKEEESNIVSQVAFFHFLSTRKGLLDGISICGGEPTLHGDLPEFITKIKDEGFLVKLDTNGTNPEMLQFLLDKKLLDFVAMDIKHNPLSLEVLVESPVDKDALKKSAQLIIEKAPDYEFRTTIIKWWHRNTDIEKIASNIVGAKSYVLQNFRRSNMVNPNFLWEPFSSVELAEFLAIAKQYIPNSSIRT